MAPKAKARPATEPEPAREELHPLAAALASTELFEAQARELSAAKRAASLEQISHLLRSSDHMSFDEFARRAGVPPFRVDGPISALETLLNVDGYAVIERDRLGRQVRLQRARLQQLFEVRP